MRCTVGYYVDVLRSTAPRSLVFRVADRAAHFPLVRARLSIANDSAKRPAVGVRFWVRHEWA